MERKRSWPAGGRVSSGSDLRAGRRSRGRGVAGRDVEVKSNRRDPGSREGRRTGIPDLQAHDSVGITVDDPFRHEARADGARRLGGVECALAVPRDERRLADALGTQDDDLGLEGGHLYVAHLVYCSLVSSFAVRLLIQFVDVCGL